MRHLIFFLALCASAQTVTIGPAVFSGSGLNDATSGGRFTSAAINAEYVVTISATGTPDHFAWTKNGGSASSPVAITGSAQSLADGVTITFAATTGHHLADFWTIDATASGSAAGARFVQQGVGALITRSVEDKLRDFVSVKDFGAKADWNGTTGTDNCAAFKNAVAALPAGGALVWPAASHPWYTSCSITQPKPSHYIGAGRGNLCSGSATCILFAAGVSGIVGASGSRGSSVENMTLLSRSTGAGSDNGLSIGDSYFYGHSLLIQGFGNDGVYDTANNVDFMHLDQILSTLNFGDGYYCNNPDCGEMNWENLVAQNNGAIQFHAKTGHSHFVNDVAEGTGTAAWDMDGLSNTYYPYCEGLTPTFTVRGDYNQIFNQYAGGCIITDSGGGNLITTRGLLFNQQIVTDSLDPNDLGNHITQNVGVVGSTCFGITYSNAATTVNENLLKYCPGGPVQFPMGVTVPTSSNYIATEDSGSANNAIKVTSSVPFASGTELVILLSHTLAGSSSTNTLQCICGGTDSTALQIRSHWSIFNGITNGYGGGGAVSVLHVIYTGNGSWFDMSQ